MVVTVKVPHLLRICHYIEAHHLFLAMVHKVLDQVENVPVIEMIDQAVEPLQSLIDTKRNPPSEDSVFFELMRATFPDIEPEPLPIEVVQQQVLVRAGRY